MEIVFIRILTGTWHAFYQGYLDILNQVSLGENSTREPRNGCCYTSHAEMEAVNKLPPIRLRGKKKKIILIVIRINRFGNLMNSTPCFKCIQYLERLNKSSGYKIDKIYYSNAEGKVEIHKLSELINSEEKHISYAFRQKL